MKAQTPTKIKIQKNYIEAMNQAMRSESPSSVASLILIRKTACALHATDVAARKLDELKDRYADRLLIIEAYLQKIFKYEDGEFIAN